MSFYLADLQYAGTRVRSLIRNIYSTIHPLRCVVRYSDEVRTVRVMSD